MSLIESMGASLASPSVTPGQIVELTESGYALVQVTRPDGSESSKFLCRFLLNADGFSVPVAVGDVVLVLVPSNYEDTGCILGKIGAYNPPDKEHVLIEAGQELSLRCGNASIKMRSDGKVLTSAVDISSLAKRTHKVRGGSVQIN